MFNTDDNKQRDKNICDLYLNGKSQREITALVNISQSHIGRILRKNKINQRSTKTPAHIANEIINLYDMRKISSEAIAKIFNFNGTTVCKILKENNINIRPAEENKRKHKMNYHYMDKIETEEQAYFLGLMYSDGNVHQNKCNFKITLQKSDDKILHIIAKLFYDDTYLFWESQATLSNGQKAFYTTLYVGSKTMTTDLIKHGCVPRKSLILTYPTWIPNHLNKHFIRGCWDGDGHVIIQEDDGKQTKTITGFTGTKDMAEAICAIFQKELAVKTCKSTISSRKGKPESYPIRELSFRKSRDVVAILDYIYDGATIYMDRKKDKYLEIKKLAKARWEKNPHLYK